MRRAKNIEAFKQFADQRTAHLLALRLKLANQLAQALAGPAQRSLGHKVTAL